MRSSTDLDESAAGPNMAGKSTVLRSTVAVALLASCGWYAPVASAEVMPLTLPVV